MILRLILVLSGINSPESASYKTPEREAVPDKVDSLFVSVNSFSLFVGSKPSNNCSDKSEACDCKTMTKNRKQRYFIS
ncbi:MAG TPA: hypothetical protein PLO83_09490 [Gammaproteobacteria bacterium]|nr:hypothetical protein [Xanthomonadales bacterium]HOP23155.1 hypothetical protein [Gammaproteobacteria bacterium]